MLSEMTNTTFMMLLGGIFILLSVLIGIAARVDILGKIGDVIFVVGESIVWVQEHFPQSLALVIAGVLIGHWIWG